MNSLDVEARCIIRRAITRERSRSEVARLYGISPNIVESYLYNLNCGTLNARKVLRVEIARLAAEKQGDLFTPTDKDRYKGTR